MICLGAPGDKPTYEFLPHEITVCRELANDLAQSKSRSEKTTAYGKSVEAVDLIGVMGEYLAYWHYGEDFEMWIDEFSGDDGVDMVHQGRRVQVKSTAYREDPRLCAKLDDPVADIYVLCFVDTERGFGRLLGYANKMQLIQEENKGRLRDGLPMNFMLRESQLRKCEAPKGE